MDNKTLCPLLRLWSLDRPSQISRFFSRNTWHHCSSPRLNKMAEEKSENQVLLLLHNAFIVTVDRKSRVFLNGALVVSNDTIEAIGQSNEILRDFSHLAGEIIDLHGKILLPGFVNTHVHTSQQLGRGIADDVDLMTWLHERIWPYESNMTEEDSYISTLLCGIELIRSGVDSMLMGWQEQ